MIPALQFLAVAAGGAIGAMLRYSVYRVVETGFPWATFIVNITGCMLASYLMFSNGDLSTGTWRLFLFVGLFGAFTTMSTFSIETVGLLADGETLSATANIVLNSVVCVMGAAIGRHLALL